VPPGDEDRPAWAPGGGDTKKPNAGWGGQDPPRLGIEVIVGGIAVVVVVGLVVWALLH
jgi:hypothetical protein